MDAIPKTMSGVNQLPSEAQQFLHQPAAGNPIRIVLGNREESVNMLIMAGLRRSHKDVHFQFETTARVREFIQLATSPETRLAFFMPPGNIDRDPGASCDTPGLEAVRIVQSIKARNPIPIIVLTVQCDARDAILAAGADVVLDVSGTQLQQILDSIARCLGLEPKTI